VNRGSSVTSASTTAGGWKASRSASVSNSASPNDEPVQGRFEDVDAERGNAVAGLEDGPSRQRRHQLVVLVFGQVNIGDQTLHRSGARGGDLLCELVLVTVWPAEMPQPQARADHVVVGDLA
jgi:hypothetical protein